MQLSAAPAVRPQRPVLSLVPASSSSKSRRIPSLGVHAATGQARVVIEGRTLYLGRAGPEANERYRQLLATWLATGKLPDAAATATATPKARTVGDLTARFLEVHVGYYRTSDGT